MSALSKPEPSRSLQVEILDLRHFSSADLRPLLEDEVREWARVLSWDYSGSAEMILRYVDAKILPGYAAIDRGRIVGYAFFVYEGSKGVIGDLFVANEGRMPDPHEVESRLLLHVIETLQHRLASIAWKRSYWCTKPAWLRVHSSSRDFTATSGYFMVLPLDHIQKSAASAASGNRNPALDEHDYQPAAALITAAYRGHVDSEINDQYRTLSGSFRFLNNIVRFPGCGTFDPEASFVAIHKRARSLVGLILCSRVRQDVGHVTQVCVLTEYRSLGLGELLIAATAGNLRQRKFSLLSLTVTEANARAVTLYRRLGFETKRVFDAFVWEG